MIQLLRRPSAFMPPAISALLLISIAAHLARFGRRPDEGTAAHLFQILMPTQAIIIAFFAFSWLPHKRRAALEVLALQSGAALAVLAVVYFLRL